MATQKIKLSSLLANEFNGNINIRINNVKDGYLRGYVQVQTNKDSNIENYENHFDIKGTAEEILEQLEEIQLSNFVEL